MWLGIFRYFVHFSVLSSKYLSSSMIHMSENSCKEIVSNSRPRKQQWDSQKTSQYSKGEESQTNFIPMPLIDYSFWHNLVTLFDSGHRLMLLLQSYFCECNLFVWYQASSCFILTFSDCRVMCFECNVAVSSIQSAVSS